jgi:hypothetical protein
MMEPLVKGNISLTEYQVKELNAIEKETDRPRIRLIRRAIEEFLMRYREANPSFAARFPRAVNEHIERELKPGLVLDTVIFKGVKRDVIVTETGWRYATDDDYQPIGAPLTAVPQQMSIIDIPKE